MIDLILTAVILGSFVLGFKAGNTFKSFGDLIQAGVDKLKKM